MKLRFSGSPGGFVVVEPAEYKVRLEGVKEAKARGSGEEIMECVLRILDDGPYAQVCLPHSWSLQQQALWRLENDLWALKAFEESQMGQPFDLDSSEVVRSLEGVETLVTFFTDTYQGQERSKVALNSFRPVEGAPAAPAPLPAQKVSAPAPAPASPLRGRKAPF